MLLPEGNLLHIDFGFIFGADPKPMPPPFRLAPQMVDAMGGTAHENFGRFKRYCCQAYNCFRDHANLILTLLGLMADAGIKDLSLAGDPLLVLAKVEEKFRLDLNLEQAELFFLSLINDSVNAFFPELFERFHKVAINLRA
jgi:phosphatidylinositol 3-kinase